MTIPYQGNDWLPRGASMAGIALVASGLTLLVTLLGTTGAHWATAPTAGAAAPVMSAPVSELPDTSVPDAAAALRGQDLAPEELPPTF